MKDVWSFTAPKKNEKEFRKYPTQKPIELLNRILLTSTWENDYVLDPFNGSGTTDDACKLNNRNYIGIKLEKEFVDLSRKRVKSIK